MHINGVVAKYMDSYVRDHLVWTPEQLCADFVAYLKKLHSRGCYGDYELIDGEIAPLHKDGQLWMVSSDANTYLMDKFNRKYEKHKVLARKKAPLFDRIRLGYRWDTTKFYDLNYGLKNGSDYEKADIVEKSTIVPWTMEHVNQQLKSKYNTDLGSVLIELSKSEIEINFYDYWLNMYYSNPLAPALIPEVCGDRVMYYCSKFRDEYALESLEHWPSTDEVKRMNIRFDFAIINWHKQKKLLIELDGHEYHKTVEQRNHDAIKRTIAANRGWQLVVITGTQINRNIDACFSNIKEFLQK